MAEGNVWTSAWLHGKSYNLSFDEHEQQNKHLEDSRDSAQLLGLLDTYQKCVCVCVLVIQPHTHKEYIINMYINIIFLFLD